MVAILEHRAHAYHAACLVCCAQVQTTESLQQAPLTVGGSLAPTDCGPFGGDCGGGWKI